MGKQVCIYLFFLLCSDLCLTIIATNLTIAVVEYNPAANHALKPVERANANANSFINIIASINDSLDLIVFPENGISSGFTTSVNDTLNIATLVTPNTNPCLETNQTYAAFMKNLSCEARTRRTFIVVNVVEKFPCGKVNGTTNCKKYGHSLYNTNAVFDRNGTIAIRYRKYNLFGERNLDRPTDNIEQTFEIDGTTFGIFTCFDLLFKKPALNLVQRNVTHFVFPTHWFSELPFLTELQAQEMWAHGNNVRLFSSGLNGPAAGSGGTGVFQGRDGAALETILVQGNHSVLVYKEGQSNSKNNHQEDNVDVLGAQMDVYKPIIDPTLKSVNSTLLPVNQTNVTAQLCYKDLLCCNFNITQRLTSTKTNNSYSYHLVAYSGIRSYSGVYNGGVELCGLIACLDTTLQSCGRKFPKYQDVVWSTVFDEITIRADFEVNENKTQFPNSLVTSFRSINASQTVWASREFNDKNKRLVERTFSTKIPQTRLLTFAIYGRNFAIDHDPVDTLSENQNNHGEHYANSINLVILTVITSLYLFIGRE